MLPNEYCGTANLGQWRPGIAPASRPKLVCLQRFEQLFHRPHVNAVFGTEDARAVVDENAADQVLAGR